MKSASSCQRDRIFRLFTRKMSFSSFLRRIRDARIISIVFLLFIFPDRGSRNTLSLISSGIAADGPTISRNGEAER